MNEHTTTTTGYKVPPLHGPEPVQMVNAQMIEAYAPLMHPHFARMIERHGITEFTAEDLFQMAMTGQCVLIAVANDKTGLNPDREVFLSVAIEVVQYPRKHGINILALGGNRLDDTLAVFWEQFKGWTYMNGARFIEASVSPGMERMLRKWGFQPVRKLVRVDLSEKHNEH